MFEHFGRPIGPPLDKAEKADLKRLGDLHDGFQRSWTLASDDDRIALVKARWNDPEAGGYIDQTYKLIQRQHKALLHSSPTALAIAMTPGRRGPNRVGPARTSAPAASPGSSTPSRFRGYDTCPCGSGLPLGDCHNSWGGSRPRSTRWSGWTVPNRPPPSSPSRTRRRLAINVQRPERESRRRNPLGCQCGRAACGSLDRVRIRPPDGRAPWWSSVTRPALPAKPNW
jgi:hypothetical protein